MGTLSLPEKPFRCWRCDARVGPDEYITTDIGMPVCLQCDAQMHKINMVDGMRRAGITGRYAESTLENFTGNDRLVEKIRKLAEEKAQDILINGPCGCGKTHIAAAFVRLLMESRRIHYNAVKFLPVVDFLLEVKATFNQRDETEESIIKAYERYRLLVFDDLGSEKQGDWTATTIYALIDRRYRNMQPTIITTNLTLEQIEQQLGSRTASRLSQYTLINISMPDYRKKRKE